MFQMRHLEGLSDDNRANFLNDSLSDVTLVVEGTRLPGHKYVLSSR
jgi:hypothetical protein